MKTLIAALLVSTATFAGTIKHADCTLQIKENNLTASSNRLLQESLVEKGYTLSEEGTLRLSVVLDVGIQEMQSRQEQIQHADATFWERMGFRAERALEQAGDAIDGAVLAVENRFYDIGFVIEDGSDRVTRRGRGWSSTAPRVLAQNFSTFVTAANAENDAFVMGRLSRIPSCELK